jgi:hypothetical protein
VRGRTGVVGAGTSGKLCCQRRCARCRRHCLNDDLIVPSGLIAALEGAIDVMRCRCNPSPESSMRNRSKYHVNQSYARLFSPEKGSEINRPMKCRRRPGRGHSQSRGSGSFQRRTWQKMETDRLDANMWEVPWPFHVFL